MGVSGSWSSSTQAGGSRAASQLLPALMGVNAILMGVNAMRRALFRAPATPTRVQHRPCRSALLRASNASLATEWDFSETRTRSRGAPPSEDSAGRPGKAPAVIDGGVGDLARLVPGAREVGDRH